MWALSDGTHQAQVSTSPAPAPSAAVLGLAPSWLPPGLAPVAASASRLSVTGPFESRDQLLGSAAGRPELLIEVTPGSVGGGSGTPTVVRGIAGRVLAAKEFSASSSTLMWDEGGAVVATYRGISLQQAQALLGSLRWASPADHLQGFAAPDDGSAVLLGQSGLSAPSTTQLELDYADQLGSQDPGRGRQLAVVTTTAGGSLSPSYLITWLEGTRAADGTVESYDPAFGTFTRVRPDGATVRIDANATGISQADVRRVADELVPVTEAGFIQHEGRASATIASQLPVVAAADLGSDRVELRADAHLRAVCVHSSGETFCSPAASGTDAAVQGSFLVDGRWTVVAVANSPITITPDSPTQQASSGVWSLVEARPGPGVTTLVVTTVAGGQGMPRPAG